MQICDSITERRASRCSCLIYLGPELRVYCYGLGTRKLRNLRENPHAAVLIDAARTQKLLLISGPVEIIEKGEEYRRLYKLFDSKLSWVKRDPWKEGEAPFIKVTPSFKAGWGLKS